MEPLGFLRDRRRDAVRLVWLEVSAGGVPAIPENGLCDAQHGR